MADAIRKPTLEQDADKAAQHAAQLHLNKLVAESQQHKQPKPEKTKIVEPSKTNQTQGFKKEARPAKAAVKKLTTKAQSGNGSVVNIVREEKDAKPASLTADYKEITPILAPRNDHVEPNMLEADEKNLEIARPVQPTEADVINAWTPEPGVSILGDPEAIIPEMLLPDIDGETGAILPLDPDEAVESMVALDPESSDDHVSVELPYLYEGSNNESETLSGVESAETFPKRACIAEQIQTLEPVMAEEATMILEVIQEKIRLLHEQVESDYDLEDLQLPVQELEMLCSRMLVCLYDEEPTTDAVKQLMHSLMIEFQEQAEAAQLVLPQDRMHEKKLGILEYVSKFVGDLEPSSQLLGRYALQLAPIYLAA